LLSAAGAVGGGYCDSLDPAPGRVGLVLADISGKGIAAALLMSNLQAALRSLVWQAAQNLPLLLKTLNLQFRESTPPKRYATMFFGDYDDATRTLRYANCGHNPPLLPRVNGEAEWLSPTAPVIGILPVFPVEVAEVRLSVGDRLAIYSDGVTDAAGPRGGEMGESGLLHEFRQAEVTPQLLAARIAAYSPGEQFDDMTLATARGL
jgi:serine phosphatase RsbU (regulator of sigma subunit)